MDWFTPISKCNRLNRFSFSYDNRGYLEYDFSAIEKFRKLMDQNFKELKILISGYCVSLMISSIDNDLFM
jgi:hypothetical protein